MLPSTILCGCAQPELKIPGFSLPPGVNDYSLADCDGSSGVYDCQYGAGRGQAEIFNNAGIQLAVAAFDPGLPVPRSRFVSSNDYALTLIQYR